MSSETGSRELQPEASRWRQEFPYSWDADDAVSRRELLRFAVFTSGALFAGTVSLAVLGEIDSQKRGSPKPIANVSQVRKGEAFYFNYPRSSDQAVLLQLPDGTYVAYGQKCTHLSCAVYYDAGKQQLLCPCHEGSFAIENGDVIAGPPPRRLKQILLEQRGDVLWAVREVP